MMGVDRECPFCGSFSIRLIPRTGRFDCDKVYCDGCKTEFMWMPPHISEWWNGRAEADGEHCPFCGGEVDFRHHSALFAGVECPTCHASFEFQGVPLNLKGMDLHDPKVVSKVKARIEAKARKAFSRRPI